LERERDRKASEGGSELGEYRFHAGSFFLPDDLLDREPAASATVSRGAIAADLEGGLRPALPDQRTDVAIGDTGAVTNDHGTSLASPIVKFNIKVAPLRPKGENTLNQGVVVAVVVGCRLG
jgi:hypothetical protein